MSSRGRSGRVRLLAVSAVVATTALAACGTRLPEDDFAQAQQGGVLVPGPDGSLAPGVVPTGGSGGPTAGPSATSGPGAGPLATSGPDGSDGDTGPGPGAANNTASDIGVTPTTITIGNISSKDNVFDPRAFVGPIYGLQAFVRWTNAHGGIHGRQIILKTCNDQGSGDANVSCVHQLIDNDKIFAMVGNAILSYDGASYVASKNVPDMGAQPIDNAYQRYPNLWDIYGEYYPRDGKQVGFNGTLYGGTEVYKYFTRKFPNVPKVAGVVEYNQSASERFGDSIASGLKYEGYRVIKKVVNFALPDYDSVAIDFRNEGVQYVYDTIDREGNVRLCKALDDNNVEFVAKVLTTQSWEQSIADDYSESPNCRAALWATGMTRNYADTQYEQVRNFRQQMAADGHGGDDQLSEWALEGWAAGVWFADAAASCGADLTRQCLAAFLSSGKPYTARGLLVPRWFEQLSKPEPQSTNCINVARWIDSRGWVTQVPDMNKNCFTLKEQPYSAG
jgi:branched-chain amino acid transport system substrate-binding protein